MLTLLINETKPLAGLFASTTGGIGSVPDISVADEGQAVSVQTFTRTAGVITDSFVAGDVLHIGIGDGVNAPVCYIELSSASPATGTMAINTVGMVALFAATSANQLTLNVGVVRTRGGYTNTIFSAPIVIHRSVIDPDTAVPTPSILGTGVAAALLVAINTALGFVRLDASARYPALDGSQITNLAGGSLTVGTTAIASGTTGRILYDNAGVLGELPVGTGVATALAVNVGSAGAFLTSAVTSITGTANEITVTGTTTPTLSLPSALTFTGKTVTGGTFDSGAFNGTVGATTPSTVAGTTGTFDSTVTVGANSQAGTLNIKNSSGTTTASISGADGSASFGSGVTTIDQYGDIRTIYAMIGGVNGISGTLQIRNSIGNNTASIDGSDGSASFASGSCTIDQWGDLVTHSVASEFGIAVGLAAGGGSPTAQIWNDGSASFANGACTINQFGDLITNSEVRVNVAVTAGVYGQAGTLNAKDSGGTTTASIDGSDGSASFASGTFTSTTSLLLGTAGSAVGNIGFRNATSGTTTLEPATGALGTGTVTLPLSGTLATLEGTETLTNKRITQRSGTATSSVTPTINTDNVDFYSLTAQAADITSFTTNLSGTPTEGQTLWIAITGTAARAITWGATFEAGAVALPTTTVSTDRLDVAFVWNTVTSKWRCMASG